MQKACLKKPKEYKKKKALEKSYTFQDKVQTNQGQKRTFLRVRMGTGRHPTLVHLMVFFPLPKIRNRTRMSVLTASILPQKVLATTTGQGREIKRPQLKWKSETLTDDMILYTEIQKELEKKHLDSQRGGAALTSTVTPPSLTNSRVHMAAHNCLWDLMPSSGVQMPMQTKHWLT